MTNLPCPTCGNKHDDWVMFWVGWTVAGVVCSILTVPYILWLVLS